MSYCQYLAGHPEDTLNQAYHDREYGFPLVTDADLLARLALEINQAGLSWTLILKRKDAFLQAFEGFDVDLVAAYGEADKARLLADAGIIHSNLLLLDAFFVDHPDRFDWVRPKAGPIAFPRLFGGDVERFCDQLVTSAGVLLLPGTMYGHPGNHFRLGFARRNMPEALERLEEFLKASPK